MLQCGVLPEQAGAQAVWTQTLLALQLWPSGQWLFCRHCTQANELVLQCGVLPEQAGEQAV